MFQFPEINAAQKAAFLKSSKAEQLAGFPKPVADVLNKYEFLYAGLIAHVEGDSLKSKAIVEGGLRGMPFAARESLMAEVRATNEHMLPPDLVMLMEVLASLKQRRPEPRDERTEAALALFKREGFNMPITYDLLRDILELMKDSAHLIELVTLAHGRGSVMSSAGEARGEIIKRVDDAVAAAMSAQYPDLADFIKNLK